MAYLAPHIIVFSIGKTLEKRPGGFSIGDVQKQIISERGREYIVEDSKIQEIINSLIDCGFIELIRADYRGEVYARYIPVLRGKS